MFVCFFFFFYYLDFLSCVCILYLQYSSSFVPSRARLNLMVGYASAWRTRNKEQGQWIQVDLGDVTKVTKIGTQGRGDSSQWVTKYKVSYSYDGGYFEFYKQEPYGDERVSLQKKAKLGFLIISLLVFIYRLDSIYHLKKELCSRNKGIVTRLEFSVE